MSQIPDGLRPWVDQLRHKAIVAACSQIASAVLDEVDRAA